MKILKKIIPLYSLAFLLILPSLSSAAWTGQGVISQMGTNVQNITVFGFNPDDPNLCDGGSPLVIPPTELAYSEMYAISVASFLQGKQINFYLNGCTPLYGASTYPRITAIRVYE